MPKLPPLSGERVVAALRRLGFEVLRQKGSHVSMRRGDRGCVVPMHKEIKIGTLRNILRQADVTVEEFLGAL